MWDSMDENGPKKPSKEEVEVEVFNQLFHLKDFNSG